MRALVALIACCAVAGCAIAPPGSLMATLADDDEKVPVSTPAKNAEPSVAGKVWTKVKAGLGIDGAAEPAAPALPSRVDTAAAERAINSYRAAKGLKAVRLNTQLITAAQAHSSDLAKNDRISHYGSDGSDAWERVRRTGYAPRLAAENVGTGQDTLAEVMDGWKKSKGHNANLLLADAREMGIAMVYRPETQFKTFWTLVIAAN